MKQERGHLVGIGARQREKLHDRNNNNNMQCYNNSNYCTYIAWNGLFLTFWHLNRNDSLTNGKWARTLYHNPLKYPLALSVVYSIRMVHWCPWSAMESSNNGKIRGSWERQRLPDQKYFKKCGEPFKKWLQRFQSGLILIIHNIKVKPKVFRLPTMT